MTTLLSENFTIIWQGSCWKSHLGMFGSWDGKGIEEVQGRKERGGRKFWLNNSFPTHRWKIQEHTGLRVQWYFAIEFLLAPKTKCSSLDFWFPQALKLWWKNVCFVQHPRYTVPSYREEALIRDQKLQCCGTMEFSGDNKHLQERGTDQGCSADINSRNRWFKWRDAKWPWSWTWIMCFCCRIC